MTSKKKIAPLESRVYKYKNKNRNFFCPLCRTERNVPASPRLSKKNHVQIALTSLILMGLLYPVVGAKGFCVFFLVWGVFELVIRSDFKEQIPCPHCGFDAAWYKRDVKVARQKVAEFWAKKQSTPSSIPESPAKEA